MNEETRDQVDEIKEQSQQSINVDPQSINQEKQTQSDCLGPKEVESEVGKLQENYLELEKNISGKLEEQRNLIKNILDSNKKSNEDSEQFKNNQLDPILDKLKGIDQLDLILSKLEGIDQLDPILDKLKGIEQLDPILSKLEGIDQLDPILNRLNGIEATLSNELRPEVTQKLGKIETDMGIIPTKIEDILTMTSSIRELFEGFEGKESSSTSNNRAIPPANEDDEMILDLADYGQKIFQQLTIAARHYAQNRGDIDAINKMKMDYENRINNTRKESFEKGKEEGGKKILEDLLSRNQDMDDFFANNDILKDYTQINGLEKDQRFVKGEQVKITSENKLEFENLAEFESLGRFDVIKSCYKFNGEVIQYAELKAIE